MALTKVTGQVIKNTTDVTVGVLTVTNTLAVGGTVSIGGTLTYEDVTNVDAVGLITARNGIVVGSGITLSKDGDIFATGVTTTGSLVSNGAISGTTGTFTSTVKSGTTATGIIFSAGDSGNSGDRVIQFKRAATTNDINIQAINSGTGATNLLFNNEGGAASFGGNVSIGDNDELRIGDGSDLKLKHDTNNSIISNATGELLIDSSIISLRDLSNNSRLRIEPAGNINIPKNLNVTGIATVGSAVTISESGIEASGIGITCANINGGKIGGRRNIIINGAMRINQRNASTTIDNGFGCDRWQQHFGNTDEAPTLSQADVASGTEPYNIGFRKCLRLTNGNQTSGAGQFDYSWMRYRGEAQDIVTSGWNYTSSTSFLTLSFYIKSSVAQNFYGYFKDVDGSPDRAFPFETGSLSANTWKRVAVVIPGDSGLTFDNNSGRGFEIFWGAFVGTYYSSNSSSVGTWKNYTDNDRVPDSTTTWYTTNDATLEITGVQLELGTEATPFEHRTFADDYRDCLRYYYESREDGNNFDGNGPNSYASGYFGFGLNGNRVHAGVRFPVPMRGIPSITIIQPSDGAANGIHRFRGVTGSNSAVDTALSNVTPIDIGNFGFLYFSASSGITQGAGYLFHIIANAEI